MKNDYRILRELAKSLREIAYLPVQEETKRLWTANNDLKPIRPMVYIDQLPWHEINTSLEMQIVCEDPYLQTIERRIRELLYRWNHFPCDMVVEKRIDIPHVISGLNYGMEIKENILKTDEENDIVSHGYEEQLETEEDLEKIKYDQVVVDEQADKAHVDLCSEIFQDILPVRLEGIQIHTGVWDRIAQMRTVENILYDLVDRPEFTEAIVKKFVDITMSTVDQAEQLGLLDDHLQYVHCTGAYTDDLPQRAAGEPVRSQNVWAFGMSQIFSTISPDMHDEFDIDLLMPLYERFGLMYYGCCEPLERKIDIIRKVSNVRKISVSPWADIEISADRIAGDYVFSCKSNPAYIATGTFDEDSIRAQIQQAYDACKRTATPLEIILKDVSTVQYRLDFLDKWNNVAMELVNQ